MAHDVPKAILDTLKAVPLLSECNKKELSQIAGLGSQIPVKAGKVLTTQGRPGSEFFVVLQGKARCEVDGAVVAGFGPGDFFGEMALLDHGPRHATVVAEEPMQVLVLDGREFRTLLSTAPAISLKVLSALAARERSNASLRS